MTDRAEEEARAFAIEWYGPDYSDAFVHYLADFLRSRDTALAEAQERIRALEGALERSADYLDDIASSLSLSMPGASSADLVRNCARRARTILSPATETEGEKS